MFGFKLPSIAGLSPWLILLGFVFLGGVYWYIDHLKGQVDLLTSANNGLEYALNDARGDLAALEVDFSQNRQVLKRLQQQHSEAVLQLNQAHQELAKIQQKAAQFSQELEHAKANDQQFKDWTDLPHGDVVNRLLNADPTTDNSLHHRQPTAAGADR